MGAANGLAGETLVITPAGPRSIETLAGDQQKLLAASGAWVTAPVQSLGPREVCELALSRSGVTKVIRAIPGHRWLLRSRRNNEYEATTLELSPGDRLQFTFPSRPAGLSVDRESAARGFVFGDGSTYANRARANFCGDKDASLLPLFDELGRPPRTYDALTCINGLPGEWKTAYPKLDSRPEQIYGWLAGYFAADGDVDKTGRPTISSASRDHLEFVRLACQAVGTGTFGVRKRMRCGYMKEPAALYMVGLMRGDLDSAFFLIPAHRARFLTGRAAAERRGWNVLSVRFGGEFAETYCAVNERSHSFALSDNILTGS